MSQWSCGSLFTCLERKECLKYKHKKIFRGIRSVDGDFMKISSYLQYYDCGHPDGIQYQLVDGWKLMKEPATSTFKVEKMKREAAGSSKTYLPNNKMSFTRGG